MIESTDIDELTNEMLSEVMKVISSNLGLDEKRKICEKISQHYSSKIKIMKKLVIEQKNHD